MIHHIFPHSNIYDQYNAPLIWIKGLLKPNQLLLSNNNPRTSNAFYNFPPQLSYSFSNSIEFKRFLPNNIQLSWFHECLRVPASILRNVSTTCLLLIKPIIHPNRLNTTNCGPFEIKIYIPICINKSLYISYIKVFLGRILHTLNFHINAWRPFLQFSNVPSLLLTYK